MLEQIIEIVEEGRHLSIESGWLTVSHKGTVLGKAPLDDLGGIIASNQNFTVSGRAIAALAERGVPLVVCAKNFTPAALLFPASAHHDVATRIEAQISVTKPRCKQIWAQLVRAKILAQSQVLKNLSQPDWQALQAMASRVGSGDPQNLEAQAARRYWQALFGKGFKRDREAEGINAMLNYGYAILRAATSRSIASAGLHPAIGIQHKSRGDGFRLADDMMEPFRPAMDWLVYHLHKKGITDLTPPNKRFIVDILITDCPTPEGNTPLNICLTRMCTSLAQVFMGNQDKLWLPINSVPLLDNMQL